MTRKELKKMLPIYALITLNLYAYGLTKTMKDALVIPKLGVEAVPTLKLYGVLPITIILAVFYMKMLPIMKKTTMYQVTNLFCASFFAIYGLLIHPNSTDFAITFSHSFISQVENEWYFFRHLIVFISNWSDCLFYIVAEISGSIMFTLLLWQIINQHTNIKSARKNYPIIMLFGQVGILSSGQTIKYFSDVTASLYTWDSMLRHISFLIMATSILSSLVFYYISNNILPIQRNKNFNSDELFINSKTTFSRFKLVLSSRRAAFIMTMVFCFAFISALSSSILKSVLKLEYPDPLYYSNFTGQLEVYIAGTSMFFTLASIYLNSMTSWKNMSLLTPILIIVTLLGFLIAMSYYEYGDGAFTVENINQGSIMILSGVLHYVCLRSCHAFFTPMKEISFISLDEPIRSFAKGFEVMVWRLSKALGALMQWIMLSFIANSSILTLIPNLLIVMLLTTLVWILSILALSKEIRSGMYQK